MGRLCNSVTMLGFTVIHADQHGISLAGVLGDGETTREGLGKANWCLPVPA